MGSGRTHAHFYRGCGPPRKSKRPGQQHAPDSMMTETAWEHQREVTCGKAGQEQPQALRHTTAARLCNAHGGGGRELWGKVLLQLQALGQSRRCAAAALAATAQENRIWFPTRPVAPNRGPFPDPSFAPKRRPPTVGGRTLGAKLGATFWLSFWGLLVQHHSEEEFELRRRRNQPACRAFRYGKHKVPRTTRGRTQKGEPRKSKKQREEFCATIRPRTHAAARGERLTGKI